MNDEVTKPVVEGAAALDFAAKHLKRVGVNLDSWEVEYVCENTGEKWILDYPNSSQHGGGSPRLRRVN